MSGGRTISTLAESLPLVRDAIADVPKGSSLIEEFVAFAELKAQMVAKNVKPEDIAAAARPENFVNNGHMSSVFAIPDLPNYVLKQSTSLNALGIERSSMLEPLEDRAPGLNFGQAIATLRPFVRSRQVLRRVAGEPHGVNDYSLQEFTPKEIADIHQRAIETAASMPQEAFSGLARNMTLAAKSQLRLDSSNPNNILVDKVARSFNMVDMDVTDAPQPSVAQMLRALAYDMRPAARPFVKSGLPDAYRALLEKSLEGARAADLHFDPAYKFGRFLRNAKISRVEGERLLAHYDVKELDQLEVPGGIL